MPRRREAAGTDTEWGQHRHGRKVTARQMSQDVILTHPVSQCSWLSCSLELFSCINTCHSLDAQSQVPAPHSMDKGSRNTHSLLSLPGSQWMLDSIYRFLALTTQTRSNFQYTRSLRSSGADNKGKVSGRQRAVCTQQPMMGRLSSSCKIDSDTSRNSHQISSLSEQIINTSDPIIQVLSVFQLPNQTIQLHTWCNFNNITPQRATERNSESRQGNIDFQIAFHYKHQAAGGLFEI